MSVRQKTHIKVDVEEHPSGVAIVDVLVDLDIADPFTGRPFWIFRRRVWLSPDYLELELEKAKVRALKEILKIVGDAWVKQTKKE